jgi:hypothetical protein
MKFRPLNILTVASLLLCVAVVALWVRSYWRADLLVLPVGARWHLTFISHRVHWLGVTVARHTRHFPPRVGSGREDNQLRDDPWAWHSYGGTTGIGRLQLRKGRMMELVPATGRQSWVPTAAVRELIVPYDYFAAAAAALPIARLALRVGRAADGRGRARARAAKNLCPRCGYDLTGNVSGVCPECGTERKGAGE